MNFAPALAKDGTLTLANGAMVSGARHASAA